MSEWWSYRLSDLLLFSPRTYYRLIENYNRDVWPAHLLAIVAGVAVLAVVLRRGDQRGGRLVAAILATEWLWVAWAFHLQRYATINWAARWFALGFVVEALLLLWIGVIRAGWRFDSTTRWIRGSGLSVLVIALFGLPLLALLAGRSPAASEFFGIHSDPTAIATLGILLLTSERVHWLLLVIPTAWCGVSGATSLAMGSPDAMVTPLVAVLVVMIAVCKGVALQRTTRIPAQGSLPGE
ncbi:MAG TPA: DUF6064 family protein [Thermoanaerobaculia bacterium]|nr:DUF6064 family protein [Thermoanaerobaculia bacterium]